MSNHKAIIDPWIEYVRGEWLEKKEKANLRRSTQNLLQKVQTMCKDHMQFNEAWEHVEELIQLQERFHNDGSVHNKETPQIFLDCGIAAYYMGNARQAAAYLNAAIAKYTDQHEKAVVHWLLGCLNWSLDDSVNAVAEWENSLNQFQEQAMKTQRDSKLVYWYRDTLKLMESAIAAAVEHNAPPELSAFRAPPSTSSTSTAPSPSANFVRMHSLHSIPVLGEIPAGAPLGVLPGTSDYLTTQTFKFTDDSEYRVVSLIPDRMIVRIQQQQEYFILRVSGNSMNICKSVPILDGDYVLLLKQDQPRDNDIVAAEIITADAKDDRATLKRYKTRGDKILLIPESSESKFQQPMYVDKMYSKEDEEFHIRGVALAVFKKL
jgi:SOS-response transcriptional repressor LexA